MFLQLYKLGVIKESESVEDISGGNAHILSPIYSVSRRVSLYAYDIFGAYKKNRMPAVQAN